MTAATCSRAMDLLQMVCGILATVSSTNTAQSKFEFTHFMQRIYVSARRSYVQYTTTGQTVIVAARLCTICVLTSSTVSKDICSLREISIHLFRVSSTQCTLIE